MFSFSTEVTSSAITSDNPLFKRTLKAYHLSLTHIYGDVLEIGCGEGYGLDMLKKSSTSLTLIDKSNYTLKNIKQNHPEVNTICEKVPPLTNIMDNTFDTVIAFQVIEHIKNDKLFIEEIYRVLKPNGKAIITTPNALKTLARNPWHYKEYTHEQIKSLIGEIFNDYSVNGIEGNKKTDTYYLRNKSSVEKLLKFDVLKLQHRMPSLCLKIPYELLNRLNRKKLMKQNLDLVNSIEIEDYALKEYSKNTLDFFCVLKK